MTIQGLGGEFAFIDHIAARAAGSNEASSGIVRVGIGDDAAVLRVSDASDILVTTDLLLEDVHFRRSYGDPYSLGVKAAAVNLSDIAAMGGTPTAAFLSLSLPRDLEVAYLDELYRGLNDTFSFYGACIAGGDTNVSLDRIAINVTLLGTVEAGGAILRSGARSGDAILVTSALGAAAAGFALLESLGREAASDIAPLAVAAQLRPIPRLAQGRAAREAGGVRAMMDLSDGLMGDLAKLCRASGVGAVVNAAAVPVALSALTAAQQCRADAQHWALYGGEDYELLLAVEPKAVESVRAAIAETGTAATIVGEITSGADILLDNDGERVKAPTGSYDHFKR